MPINYATKYSSKIDEVFTLGSLTEVAVNKDYDFVGARTVKVYSMETAEMVDYTATGSNRYGTPTEIQDTIQELVMSQAKSFARTIDRINELDSNGARTAGEALRRQIDERVIPMIDVYRLTTMVANAGTEKVLAVTAANAYETFLDGTAVLTDNRVPLSGRVAFVSSQFYKLIKLDSSFVKASEAAQEMLTKGSLGMVDGVNIIPVPSSYLPSGVQFVITHKVATTAPVKLEQYKIHVDPPGISGSLIEGLVYHDAFVMNNKKGAIYVHKSA